MHIHWWGIRFWAGIYIHISQNIELGKQRSQYIYSLPPDSLPANLTMAEKCHSNLSSLHGKRPSQHPRKAFSEVTFDCCQEHISIYSMSAAYEKVLFWECICGSNLFLNFGWPGGSDSKESACSAGDPGSIPGLVRSPGEGNGYSLQHSCLENSMDRGAWWATSMELQRIGHHWATNTFHFSTKLA